MEACNPNVIELLGTKEEHQLFKNDIAKSLSQNKKIFLSKKAFYSFAGHANAQLRWLESALAGEGTNKNKHIVDSFKTQKESRKTMESSKLPDDVNRDKINIFVIQEQ